MYMLVVTTYIMTGSGHSFLMSSSRHYGAQNCPPQLKNFPASTFTPQQLTTTSIHFDHSCHHKFFSRTTKRTCQKWNHDVKTVSNMSKIINKSTKGEFSLRQYSCCILLASMKMKCSIWSTHDFHEDRFCHQNFDTLTNFIIKNKNNDNLFLI